MSNPDINQFGGQFGNLGAQQDPNIAPIGAPSETSAASSAPASPLSASSIEKSEETAEALAIVPIAANPILANPTSNATSIDDFSTAGIAATSATTTQAIMEKTANNIINSMWDSYMKSIREFSLLSQEKYEKDQIVNEEGGGGAKSATAYLSYLMSMSASERYIEEAGGENSSLANQFQNAYSSWIVNPANHAMSNAALENTAFSSQANYPDPTFIVGALVCSPALIREAIGSDHNPYGIQLSTSPISDSIAALGPVSGLPVDTQAAAALVAALLNTGAVYKATNDAIEQGVNKGEPPRDLDFALNYAQGVIAIVSHPVKGDERPDSAHGKQNRLIRLMLTSMALNMVYRAAYGGMSGEEFRALLHEDTSKLPEPIRETIQQLVGLINGYLPKDPAEREATIANLADYVDKKQSTDSMLSATRAFSGVLKNRDMQQGIIDAAQG